ncbi:hypothetical protein P879_08001 [Paragonimus westermani]|uniref:Uncharacterized protein n=1 Tax=Paragonimus westermani TaxID=34504 RepID=A0A8T0DL24_9TREM|nr:hypothetical protein P879_08001 [Paragonimus westermani]
MFWLVSQRQAPSQPKLGSSVFPPKYVSFIDKFSISLEWFTIKIELFVSYVAAQ